ncbi:MAG: Tn3 family transposase [Pirellulaceae bacterium]
MPVDFLTDEQADKYGRFNGEPNLEQLARHFHLDDVDLGHVRRRRGDHNRLGFAIQLCTVRFLGAFLLDPVDVPPGVVSFVAKQLAVVDDCLPLYSQRPPTRLEHSSEIQRLYGYRNLGDGIEQFKLIRWLYIRSWLSAERPSVLFDLATARLVERKVLLPGVSVLARIVSRVRDRASARVWRILSKQPSAEQRSRLERLLLVEEGNRLSELDRLRKSPTRVSGPSLVAALERLDEIRELGMGSLNLERIPTSRITALARHAASTWSQRIQNMATDRRIATLVAFAHVFEATAMDDALDVLDMLITEITHSAELNRKKERLRTIRDLDYAALQLADACSVILEQTTTAVDLETIFSRVTKDELEAASKLVKSLARPSDEQYQKELVDCYGRVRRFLPKVLNTISFRHTDAGKRVFDALEFLHTIEGKTRPDMGDAPLDIATRRWKRVVMPDGKVDRRAYTLCVLEQLQDKLRRRDIYVTPSQRWGDPRAKLIHGGAWEKARQQVCKSLDRCDTADEELERLGMALDEAYHRVAGNIPNNAAVEVEQTDGRDTLKITALDRLEEPASLLQLREDVNALLPRVDLPEVILEIQQQTGFLDEFTHISEGNARVQDLPVSICAVLIAEACNIGFEPLVRRDIPALTRSRLSWVQQNYIRSDTLTAANAKLVDFQSEIPLALTWGGGEVASADGLRFVVHVRTINARPNSKYFGTERGITYYNFTSDQFTGFHGIVIPGTLRDSMFVLDGLLEQETSLKPLELMTDTAGVSDVVFGLFWLLGYQFSPRLADIGESRFWRIDTAADYGPLNGIARNRISTRLISNNWDDMLRVAGSLKMGTVSASELIRSLLRSQRPTTLTRAIAEVGRISKTLYQLNYIDQEAYRRRILTQLNRGEGRNGMARATFHGQRGEIRKRYREGQEDQLGALGLVVNTMVLWNTIYTHQALEHLRADGGSASDEDAARLSPLEHGHFNFLGTYSFRLTDEVRDGQLRPLRSPEEIEEMVA